MAKLKNQSLEDPLIVVEKLKNGVGLSVPESIHIAEVRQKHEPNLIRSAKLRLN